ncbi:MAG: hypothetical protein HYU66_24845 [Armatimonadetes bacterium]|nr:hypothetical protein [Armatimonadota bacterium]
MERIGLGGALALALLAAQARAEPHWLRAGLNVDRPVWGFRDGLLVGLWPGAVEGVGDGGPRGLIRLGYPVGEPPHHELINFIAVEPDVGDGHWRGRSEIEPGADGRPGKVFTAGPPDGSPPADRLYPGQLDRPPDNPDAERLQLGIDVERFANGAHVRLVLTLRSDRPDEVMLQAFARADSAPVRSCVLTATMGNKARLRHALLADGLWSATALWPGHAGHEFTPFQAVPLARLRRNDAGDVLVPMECDEPDPAANWPHDPADWWRWRWEKLVQWWRVPAADVGPGVHFAANGRARYYGTALDIPGGVAFENTEIRMPFRPGRAVGFGITRRREDLGL